MVVGAVASGWLANHENVSLDFAAAALAATNNHLILFFCSSNKGKSEDAGSK